MSAEGCVDVRSFLGQEKEVEVAYNRRDLIVYAVGIGCSELRFVYENDPSFSPFPTYPIVLGFKGTDQDVVSFPSPAMMDGMVVPPLPGSRFVLDGERYLQVLHPLPKDGGKLKLRSKLIGIHKRGKGALVETESTLYDEGGISYMRLISGSFVVGAKNFQPEAAGQSFSEKLNTPSREPDAVDECPTSEFQTHIYRLSGDYNPLHIDPAFAAMNGFQRPILHGLCTFGYAARAVLKHFADNDPSKFKAIKCRFASPVIPGETLITKMWREGTRVIFNTLVKERGVVVVNNAFVELHDSASKL